MRPRFTDSHRWKDGYCDVARTNEPGYLARKFHEIQDRMDLEAKAKSEKVSAIRSKRGA